MNIKPISQNLRADPGPFAPPPTYVKADAGKKWVKDWNMSDEFDKRGRFWVNRRRWLLFNPNWAGRAPGIFRRDHAYVQRGALILKSKEETRFNENIPHTRVDREGKANARRWGTAFVRTKEKRKYGYYEIKCKMMDSAVSSAFWFAHNRDFEIDVFEYSTSQKVPSNKKEFKNLFMMNTHVFTGKDRKIDTANPAHVDVGRDLSKEIVKVGLLWTRQWIVWYLNDVEVRRIKNTDIHTELHLQLDSELFPDWFGYPGQYGPDKLPNQFEIYYVRSWRMKND